MEYDQLVISLFSGLIGVITGTFITLHIEKKKAEKELQLKRNQEIFSRLLEDIFQIEERSKAPDDYLGLTLKNFHSIKYNYLFMGTEVETRNWLWNFFDEKIKEHNDFLFKFRKIIEDEFEKNMMEELKEFGITDNNNKINGGYIRNLVINEFPKIWRELTFRMPDDIPNIKKFAEQFSCEDLSENKKHAIYQGCEKAFTKLLSSKELKNFIDMRIKMTIQTVKIKSYLMGRIQENPIK
ncbi:MAG: hypothetical protein Q7S92_03620 [Candidatus Diapherotrites archaeon]|nr:hypothetical protein [Candidatus Diapherotrites archaeon]